MNTIKFGTLNPDGTLTNVREIKREDVASCPHVILLQEHYRLDGGCKCDDPDALEMAEWGYVWQRGAWR